MFRSCALCCAPRTIGAVLTGTLGDGAAGLSALKHCGGGQPTPVPEGLAYEVDIAKLRWRIERDYQELKQEIRLGHY